MSKDAKGVAYEIAQECISKSPVIILGSGASAAYGLPGMPGLKDHLLTVACPTPVKSKDVETWSEFLTKLGTTDPETALNEVRLSEALIAQLYGIICIFVLS